MPRPIYLGCDIGIDDSLALAYLLASPETRAVGIGTVHGNVSAAQGAINTRNLLRLSGHRAIPLTAGRTDPLVGEFDGGSPHVHGENGIGDVDIETNKEDNSKPVVEHASKLLLRLPHEYAAELEIIAIGPLTNIAIALERDPSLAKRIRRVTLMGGAAMVPTNIMSLAEANIAHDPEAAQAVVSAPWQVTLVPLGTTLEHLLEEADRERLSISRHSLARVLGQMLDFYHEYYVSV